MSYTSRRDLMIEVISRIAQHACRQGEKGDRLWPPIAELPYLKSWQCVGEKYADQALAILESGWTAEAQMRDCVEGPDAKFKADMVDCLDAVFDQTKRWTKNPRMQRSFVESLIESAIAYGRQTTTQHKSQPGSE